MASSIDPNPAFPASCVSVFDVRECLRRPLAAATVFKRASHRLFYTHLWDPVLTTAPNYAQRGNLAEHKAMAGDRVFGRVGHGSGRKQDKYMYTTTLIAMSPIYHPALLFLLCSSNALLPVDRSSWSSYPSRSCPGTSSARHRVRSRVCSAQSYIICCTRGHCPSCYLRPHVGHTRGHSSDHPRPPR